MGTAGAVLGFCFQQWDIRICILWYIQRIILLSFDVFLDILRHLGVHSQGRLEDGVAGPSLCY